MIQVSKVVLGSEELKAVEEVLYSGRLAQGEKVEEFEEKFAEYIGTDHAVAVNSGTAALYLSLRALGIGKGDEVILPPTTFFATVSAVLQVGARPVFVDVDLETFTIDPEKIEKAITPRTKAIIPVHLFGGVAEMDKIKEIALEHDLSIIEDSAQAHGAEYKGEKAGSFGDCGCFSFYATKNMTTGEGGMITTNNEELVDELRKLRNHGMLNYYTHVRLSGNYRMSEIAAAIGIVQLKRLDALNKIRIRIATYLRDKLRDISWLEVPVIPHYIKHVFYWNPVVIDGVNCGIVKAKIKSAGIEIRDRYKKLAYEQPVIDGRWKCENAEYLAQRIIGLPSHPFLCDSEIDYIVKTLHEVVV